ncbi:unnamed protein product [Ambrosiozyma monospora]|uniref:Unnamed protein product n=1 Tax=Ambrosiozyma monospora TaxID=43982 RepID=A0ACB5TTC5_AMBMO|nr:unnamed protein product [Ambrosiozyma monospora]
MLEPKRDFAYIKLHKEVDSVVAVVENLCYVATFDGDFLVYSLPSSNGAGSRSFSEGNFTGSGDDDGYSEGGDGRGCGKRHRSVSGGSGSGGSGDSANCVLLKQYRLIE